MDRKLKQTFHQRRLTYYLQAHEKMLNNANYQRNANQNYLKWELPGGPVVRTLLPLQETQVQSLVGELRSCMVRRQNKYNEVSLQNSQNDNH